MAETRVRPLSGPLPGWGEGWAQEEVLDFPGGERVGVWTSPWPGRRVVAVHGMEDTWHTWDALARRLAGRCRIVALDLPWRAGNDYRWHRAGDSAHWVAAALARLGTPAEMVFGHSMGGHAVLRCLDARVPEVAGAAAVVLHAPIYRPAGVPVSREMRDRSAASLRRVISEGMRIRLGGRLRSVDEEILRAMETKTAESVMEIGFPVFFGEFSTCEPVDLTGAAVPPTLVLAGPADEGLTRAQSARFAEVIPGARVRRKEEYGHFCHIEHAADAAREIGDFLDTRVPPAGADRPRVAADAVASRTTD